MDSRDLHQRASDLHAHALVLDMTMPMLQRSDLSLFWRALERMRASGYSYVSLTIAADHTGTWETLRNLVYLRTLLARRPWIRFVRNVDDIRRADAESKLAVGLNFQGTVPVGRRLQLIRLFYKLGIRHMLMAYNSRNRVGSGCHDAVDEGLTPFGRALIATMNRVGMLVDVAHTGYRTSLETIAASSAPVVVSHGNVWAVHEHPRCYRDEQIKAVAASGGVFGVTGFGLFLGPGEASVEQFVRHLDHVVQLVRARDFYGNNVSAPSNAITVTTDASNPSDTEPPSPPGNLSGSDMGCAEVWLSWTESLDNQTPQSAILYEVFVNGVLDHTLIGTDRTILYGTINGENTLTVIAIDGSGNRSAAAFTALVLIPC